MLSLLLTAVLFASVIKKCWVLNASAASCMLLIKYKKRNGGSYMLAR